MSVIGDTHPEFADESINDLVEKAPYGGQATQLNKLCPVDPNIHPVPDIQPPVSNLADINLCGKAEYGLDNAHAAGSIRKLG
jgi:hypothetical protein